MTFDEKLRAFSARSPWPYAALREAAGLVQEQRRRLHRPLLPDSTLLMVVERASGLASATSLAPFAPGRLSAVADAALAIGSVLRA